MDAAIMINSEIHYYNTKTAYHICGLYNTNNLTITELHLTKKGYLFFAIYNGENIHNYITPATTQDALEFIGDHNKQLLWFDGGKQLLQDVINNRFQVGEDFTE